MKTVGLLSIMAQSGLFVPAEGGSSFGMHSNILCDIGDGQSITENLSTFSSHITNIISILENTTNESLVLLDELGSGTDPAEGMGIATAILEELRRRGCLFVATTHYPEIKEFAKSRRGLINARMGFDRESLCPLYRLEIGEAGESCALHIAKRLGFPAHMLEQAHSVAYGQEREIRKVEIEDGEYITKKAESKITREHSTEFAGDTFNIGDSVTVYPQRIIGIICKRVNQKGELGVQIKGEKSLVNHKRLKLHTEASELYPEDYDFSIIFDSVANRKARHKMEKGHKPDLVIMHEEIE